MNEEDWQKPFTRSLAFLLGGDAIPTLDERGQRVVGDVAWFQPDGNTMGDDDWNVSFAKSLGQFLNGEELPHVGTRGEPIHDSSFYLLFNAHDEPIDFVLPEERWGKEWTRVLDTAAPDADGGDPLAAGAAVPVVGRSVVVLERTDPERPGRRG
jgi:glycogen operon protein